MDMRALGFEREPTAGMPEGWYGFPPPTIASDTQVVHGGKRSLRLERHADSPGTFSFVARNLPLDFAGKTIELRGWLKREGEGLPSLWLRQDGETGSIAFADMSANPAVSSTWEQHSISFDVKEGARQLVIGCASVTLRLYLENVSAESARDQFRRAREEALHYLDVDLSIQDHSLSQRT